MPTVNLSPSILPLPPFCAQVAVEGLQGPELDYSLLAGKWLLVYTTANDVLPILEVGEPVLGAGKATGLREVGVTRMRGQKQLQQQVG